MTQKARKTVHHPKLIKSAQNIFGKAPTKFKHLISDDPASGFYREAYTLKSIEANHYGRIKAKIPADIERHSKEIRAPRYPQGMERRGIHSHIHELGLDDQLEPRAHSQGMVG
ncbi:hypothetical protein EV421DRAFT_2023456 [Armillaria borealis]|uniref:Uncharacterized protein n=1 Tax=Armillaria borealis TaxID=47425 RepID=A0AA39IZU4_9AGAR|nr:hypothetical protein EV421DRAFT_2023456 [Armillaria borealis]